MSIMTGIALGVWISDEGHINPAVSVIRSVSALVFTHFAAQVTLAFATWRKFPWKKVPYYILAQVLGAVVGAAIVYGNYFHAISVVENGSSIRTMKTAGLFGTFPVSL
jgi:aquaglyceroporin related protein